jgi:hypothetical protein
VWGDFDGYMKETNRLKELELEKHDLESDIAFLNSAYKYDLQRLEYQLGGIENKLQSWRTQSDQNIACETWADESVTVESAGR